MKKPINNSKQQEENEENTKEDYQLLAQYALKPAFNSAAAIENYAKIFGKQNIVQLAEELMIQNEKLADGDLTRLEAMLFDQSHALQSIFANLSRRAINAEYISNLERYLRLALKAQAQCARTLEILGTIKNPVSVALVRQANIGHAVQVNNVATSPSETEPHARKNPNLSNELLEVTNGQRLDARTTSTTINADPQLEPIKQVDGAENHWGQNTIKPKRL